MLMSQLSSLVHKLLMFMLMLASQLRTGFRNERETGQKNRRELSSCVSWASFVHVIVLFHLQVQHYLVVINNFSSAIVNRN